MRGYELAFAVSASGMRGANGLFNDGLVLETCKNNGQVSAFS